ncbi:nucleotidyltransferase family protein [Catalinimonas sp. 4WD22]|uniref:nucleotidyltransferase family protein n=1 Tax=Catalinimonas locisalis TaxID=3133978 RepID=UPI00310194CA
MSASEKHAIVILAAGESSRMGQPKQLLQINGKSLLRHAVEEAIDSDLGPVIVVLGAFAEQIKEALPALEIKIVHNPDWQQGMGTSIQKGIQEVQKEYDYSQGAILMLSDQPYVNTILLNKLLQTHLHTQKPIVASTYQDTLGVPAYFHHSYFPFLSQLEGSIGARKLIQQHKAQVASVDFPSGRFDVDTPEDYKKTKEKIERGT